VDKGWILYNHLIKRRDTLRLLTLRRVTDIPLLLCASFVTSAVKNNNEEHEEIHKEDRADLLSLLICQSNQ